MNKNTQDPAYLLKVALSEHLSWHEARLNFLAHFLLALLKVRSVNLAELATGFDGRAKTDSHYKRLQRFFRSFELNYDELARLLVRLLPIGHGPWYLTLAALTGNSAKPILIGHCLSRHRLARILERARQSGKFPYR